MAPTSDTLIKGYSEITNEETGEVTVEPFRYMTPDEIKERDALNIANTASALRAKVVDELAKSNGSGGHGSNGSITNT